MSMFCWGIIGYGLEVKPEMFDVQKAMALLDYEGDNLADENDFYGEFEGFLNILTGEDLDWNTDADGVFYLMVYPAYPWDKVTEKYRNFTKESVEDYIIDTLKPYLSEKADIDALKNRIGYINA